MKYGTGMALTDKDFETYKSNMNIIQKILNDIGDFSYRFGPEATDFSLPDYQDKPLCYKSKKIIYTGKCQDIQTIAVKIRNIIDKLVDCISLLDPNFRKTTKKDNKENTKDSPYFDFDFTTQADFLKNLDNKYPCYYTFFPIRITNPNDFVYERQDFLHGNQICQTEIDPHVIALIAYFTGDVIHNYYDEIVSDDTKQHIIERLNNIHPTHYVYIIFKSYLESNNVTFLNIFDDDIWGKLVIYLRILFSQNVCNRINTQKSSKNKICIEESIFSQQQKDGIAFVKCSEEHYLDIKQ